MCMSSILHLKPALEAITNSNLKTDNFLRSLIPTTQGHFEVIKKIVPILQVFSDFTDVVSSEKYPTAHLLIAGLYNLAGIDKTLLPIGIENKKYYLSWKWENKYNFGGGRMSITF